MLSMKAEANSKKGDYTYKTNKLFSWMYVKPAVYMPEVLKNVFNWCILYIWWECSMKLGKYTEERTEKTSQKQQ